MQPVVDKTSVTTVGHGPGNSSRHQSFHWYGNSHGDYQVTTVGPVLVY